jgi:hypothetical protein
MRRIERLDETRGESVVSRRRFLVATSGVVVTGLAGCSELDELTTYEFEAETVGLPEEAQEEAVLAEIERDTHTETREPGADGVEGEVSITSKFVGYHRGPARGTPTLMEAFIGEVNGTHGSGPATVGPVPRSFFDDPPTDTDRVSAVIPAGAYPDGERDASSLLSGHLFLIDHPRAMEIPPDLWSENYMVPVRDFLPPERPDWPFQETQTPFDDILLQWVPGASGSGGVGGDGVAVIPTGERSFQDVFGRSPEAFDARRAEGDLDAYYEEGNMLLAVPGDVFTGGQSPFTSEEFDREGDRIFDEGRPAPLGGATYGLGILSTPRAEVGGEAQNPFATEGLGTLLESEAAADMLRQSGLTDAANPRWLAGPEDVGERFRPDAEGVAYLGEEPELRTFAGVINSADDTPVNWDVGLHLARVQHGDDAVMAVGGHRTPSGTAESPGVPNYDADESGQDRMGAWFAGGAEMTAATLGRVAVVEFDDDK